MENNTYFNLPMQVIYADMDLVGEWRSGIGYQQYVICGCCGAMILIDDIIATAQANGIDKSIYPYEEWNDITYEVLKGNTPEGLTIADGKIVVASDEE